MRRDGEEILIEVSARSFLHHQVRNIAGTLALVGKGKWSRQGCGRRAGRAGTSRRGWADGARRWALSRPRGLLRCRGHAQRCEIAAPDCLVDHDRGQRCVDSFDGSLCPDPAASAGLLRDRCGDRAAHYGAESWRPMRCRSCSGARWVIVTGGVGFLFTAWGRLL